MKSRPAIVTPPDAYVRIGRLGRSFKLDGGVRLLVEAELDDAELDALLVSRPRMFVAGLGETRLRGADTRTGSLVILLERVRDRTAARSLVNAAVWVSEADLSEELLGAITAPSTEEALTGLPVIVDGVTRGEVVGVHLDRANPHVEVRSADGKLALVTLAAPYVEVTAEALVLDSPPAGLLD